MPKAKKNAKQKNVAKKINMPAKKSQPNSAGELSKTIKNTTQGYG